MAIKKNPLNKALAKPGDPLVTERGLTITPEKRHVDVEADAEKLTSKVFKASTKRTLKELPAPIGVINGIACVFMLTALGIGDREIMVALKIDLGELKTIRQHSAYEECFNAVQSEFVNANSEIITARLAAYSQNALTQVANISANGKKEETRLSASKDILDRSGIRAVDQAARRSVTGKDLRIVFVDGDKSVEVNINETESV